MEDWVTQAILDAKNSASMALYIPDDIGAGTESGTDTGAITDRNTERATTSRLVR